MIEKLKCAGLILFVFAALFAPQIDEAVHRIRFGKPRPRDESGRG